MRSTENKWNVHNLLFRSQRVVVWMNRFLLEMENWKINKFRREMGKNNKLWSKPSYWKNIRICLIQQSKSFKNAHQTKNLGRKLQNIKKLSTGFKSSANFHPETYTNQVKSEKIRKKSTFSSNTENSKLKSSKFNKREKNRWWRFKKRTSKNWEIGSKLSF